MKNYKELEKVQPLKNKIDLNFELDQLKFFCDFSKKRYTFSHFLQICLKKSNFFKLQNLLAFFFHRSFISKIGSFSFPNPPTSHELQYISVTSGFTRLSMKTKFVCRGLISLYVNFHENWTMWSTNLLVKICRWGGGGRKKSPKIIG